MAVPYKLLERAKRDMSAQYPNATSVKALWTPASNAEIHVEVWTGDHARVLPWEPTR